MNRYHPSQLYTDLERIIADQGLTINDVCKSAGVSPEEYAERRSNSDLDKDWLKKIFKPLHLRIEYFFPPDGM